MVHGNAGDAEPPLFSAILTPHRSLDGAGFVALMIAIGGLSLVAGMAFLFMGAWPVDGFLALDLPLIYWAFRANYRAAQAWEEVTVTSSELRVRQTSHAGMVTEWSANPLWARLDRETDEEFGLRHLFLVARGARLPIAAFLGPGEKESFARALAVALSETKRGPTRTLR